MRFGIPAWIAGRNSKFAREAGDAIVMSACLKERVGRPKKRR